ncbi:MAG: A/G-specific adenine glycosylase [Candidatus Dormibacteraeota bacterium]|uniref:A/G-specific adenine glycosylase n=1 Tax=Candidatus Amunia macphersoniae TaxID=3127014 RepID=A0A934N9G1_9BACT|nr:A/G-specific adenine glycosylase [Candidatus Dormibacteraeota bacterium]
MWSDPLPEWYAARGRHQLPWRLTTDPWAVLVSEVMLQQTAVSRVLLRWERFTRRWPDPSACASASLEDVLREWHGLGYPRRARALWLTAARVAVEGWPATETGLHGLPGIGTYTARALLAFSDLGAAAENPPPAPPVDVNLGRVAARAVLGRDPGGTTRRELDSVLAAGRPPHMTMREYAYALFDVGALHCRALPRCDGCALQGGCRFGPAAASTAAQHRRQPRYQGSLRQLRGAILTASLADAAHTSSSLREAVAATPGVTTERVEQALSSLIADGLVAPVNNGERRSLH